ncbi:MAG TPA: FkbM family methyltransferase [Solirubrobacteraceae bacterium]|nr:FkbM family methyltransferase [Solirubrobacteraceae bacterium]
MAATLPRRALAAAIRRHVLREGATWRIPMGLGQGLRVAVQEEQSASLHLYLGTAETEIAPHIRRLLAPGMRCVDIGGNNAYYAMIFARLTRTEVVSIDFADDAIALAERNLALNPALAPLVRLERCYVAGESIPARGISTLDDLLARGVIAPPDFLKMDVEGAEHAVLQGATRILREHRPSIVAETHGQDVETAVAERLLAAGYTVRIVNQRRWLREGRPLKGNRWLVAEPRS